MGSQKIICPNLKNPPNFAHLQKITSNIGLYQHCKISRPDKAFGYSVDDNARALLVCVWAHRLYPKVNLEKLILLYSKFIERMQRPDGRFHNYLSNQGKFADKIGSWDNFGRVFWALRFSLDEKLKFQKTLVKTQKYLVYPAYPRARSFIILGLSYKPNNKDKGLIQKLAQDLCADFKKNSSQNWYWLENNLTYDNAIVPYALLRAYKISKNKKFLIIALKALDFLLSVCQKKGKPAPIGQAGWYQKGDTKAMFDQQCTDVASMILALTQAYQVTGQKKYLKKASSWFLWFYGYNITGVKMYNKNTGAVYDGLMPEGKVNKNQGAESALAYLLSYLALAQIKKEENVE